MAGGGSVCIPGTNIVAKTQENLINQIKSNKYFKKWMKDPLATEMGWNDKGSLEWLWKKYTRTVFDPVGKELNSKDVNIFLKALKNEFLPSLGRREGLFGTYFKLPRVLAKGFKGGEEFVTEIGEAVSYNQKLMKDGSTHIKKMIDGMYEMFLDVNAPYYSQARNKQWSKKEYKEFQRLERDLLVSTPGTTQNSQALKNLLNMLGASTGKSTSDPLGGQILRRFQDILEFKVQPVTQAEKKVRAHWDILRVESMKDLLNGSIAARRTIETLLESDPARIDLLKAHDKITEAIDQLLVQSDFDARNISNKYKVENGITIPQNPKDMMVYDPKTKTYSPYRIKGTENTAIGIQYKSDSSVVKYSPKYVMELTDIMHNLSSYAKDSSNKAAWNGKTASEIRFEIEQALSPQAISNRMKIAGETDKYHSLDPVYYLNKYVHDVASFNMRSRINYSYAQVTKPLIEAVRQNNMSKKNIKIGEYAEYLIDLVTEIKDSSLMNNGGPSTNLDQAVRIINGFEYISKLGFSFKGGLKNRTQALFNWVQYGLRGRRVTSQFLDGTLRPVGPGEVEITNREMTTRQMKKFGFMIGEKAEAASISAATAGSIDQATMVLIPKGFDVDASGRLIVSKNGQAMKNVANLMAKGADLSSKYTFIGKVGSQAWAENKNRVSTFEMAFSHAFIGESKRIDYHRAKYLEKNGKNATEKQIWQYIENLAGKEAFEMVKTLHYDYDMWAKSRILRTPAGKTLGQFQHFKFAFFDMQYNMLRDMTRDIKGFKWVVEDPLQMGNRMLNKGDKKMIVNPTINTGMRLMMLYSFLPGLFALVTDHDVGGAMSVFAPSALIPKEDKMLKDGTMSKAKKNSISGLIENPVMEDVSRLIDFIGNSPDGTEEEMLTHYDAYFGKHPITHYLGGPFVSDVITAAELTDFWSWTSEEYQQAKDLTYDTSDPDWWYKVARIFNIAGARTAWKTAPALAKGQIHKAFRIETGTYKPQWITKWREKQLKGFTDTIYTGNVLPKVKYKGDDKRSKKTDERIKQDALLALANFG